MEKGKEGGKKGGSRFEANEGEKGASVKWRGRSRFPHIAAIHPEKSIPPHFKEGKRGVWGGRRNHVGGDGEKQVKNVK